MRRVAHIHAMAAAAARARRIAALRSDARSGPYSVALMNAEGVEAANHEVADVHGEALALIRDVKALLSVGSIAAAQNTHAWNAAAAADAGKLTTRRRAGALIALHARALKGDMSVVQEELDSDLIKANVRMKFSYSELVSAGGVYNTVDRCAARRRRAAADCHSVPRGAPSHR